MRILIVHDREEVSAILQEIAAKEAPHCEIDVREDLLGARDTLRERFYDLMILDLTLPVDAQFGAPSLQNVDLLLKQIISDPAYKVPADILGITADDDALSLVKNSISEHLMASIPENADGAWKEMVAQKVRYVRSSRQAREIVSHSSYGVDVAIVTALDKEAAPYDELLELRSTTNKDISRFAFRSRDGEMRKGVLLKIGRSGQAPAASETQALISLYRPRLIIMTGFCGGREARTGPGDLIAFTTSFAWDYGKWVEKQEREDADPSISFEPRPTPLSVEENGVDHLVRTIIARNEPNPAELERRVKETSDGAIKTWRVRRAAAGSGSAVVTSEEILERISGLDENIYAVDMESYGFYLACRTTRMAKPDFLCLKSVADFCNGQKNSGLHEACSMISAEFAKRLITKEYDFR